MDIISEDEKMVSVHFNSLIELIEFEPPKKNKEKYNEMLYTRKRKETWLGRGNHIAKQVLDKALVGDPYLYGLLESYLAELDELTGYHTKAYEQTIVAVKRRKFHGNYGDELDIHKIYQGRLDTAWARTERIEVSRKLHLVTLFIDLGGSLGQSASDSIWRAAVAVRLLSELERSGKSVRLVTGILAVNAIKGKESHKYLTSTITVKEYNQNISLERLAAMTHLGFMRCFCFAGFYAQKHSLYSSLGQPKDVNQNMPIQLQAEVDAGHAKYVYLGRAMCSRTALKCLEKAYEQMEEFSDGTAR